MAVVNDFKRSYVLKRIDTEMKILHESVESCSVDAILEVRLASELIRIRRQNGEISLSEYTKYDKMIQDEIHNFMRKCVCKCRV